MVTHANKKFTKMTCGWIYFLGSIWHNWSHLTTKMVNKGPLILHQWHMIKFEYNRDKNTQITSKWNSPNFHMTYLSRKTRNLSTFNTWVILGHVVMLTELILRTKKRSKWPLWHTKLKNTYMTITSPLINPDAWNQFQAVRNA